MTHLYQVNLHEAIIDAQWSAEKATAHIEFIIDQTLSMFDEKNLWPVHPDITESYKLASPIPSLWLGAAGTIAALQELSHHFSLNKNFNHVVDTLDAKVSQSLTELSQQFPCDIHSPSYLFGSSAIYWLAYKLTKKAVHLDKLYQCVADNTTNPANELMWAAPGTLLTALFAYESTGEEKWLTLFQASADYLFSTWQWHDEPQLHLWQQNIYGIQAYITGLVHGFAGNVYALMRGMNYLTVSQQKKLIDDGLALLVASAVEDEQYANWLPCVLKAWEGSDEFFLQVCHGAPSMILAYADFWPHMNDQQKKLLLKGAELTWHAGPLKKPWGLCHGTAGNGWAFLKMAHLTGDQRWFARARQFAMHAIYQSNAMYQQYGQIRTDYWCGDLGLALYLQACMNEKHEFLSLGVCRT